MAARWGAGEETLTIGGMELFTASGPLQCDDLDEDESCHDLSDLGILGTLQGYIDNSIISIIDDSGAQTENKGQFDEGNELSLLTALTEILDNADDENMSPFDSIPDTELLASPKDRDGCSRFLSRTQPDREMPPMDDQRWVNFAKVDILCPGSNWDLFPETITSTPMRRTRHKSVRAYLPRRARTGHILQRSDGEEEDQSQSHNLLPADDDSSLDPDDEIVDYDNDRLMKHGTPCIINTANVPLSDLVKYMHPYCLPSITLCLDPEDEDILEEDGIFLEIVSDQGESIKVPIMVEDPGEAMDVQSSEDDVFVLNPLAGVARQPKYLLAPESSSEQCVPEVDVNYEKIGELMEDKELLKQSVESMEEDEIMEIRPVEDKIMEAMPVEDKIMELLPVEDKIMEAMPVEDKIMELLPLEDTIMELLPVEDKIMKAMPVEDKIMEALPVDKIMESLLGEDKIMEALPVEDKIMEAVPVDKIMELLPVEDKIMQALPVEDKIMEALPVEDKIMEAMPVEDKIMEAVPEVEKMSTESLNADGTVDILDDEAPADADASNLTRKPENEDLIVPDKEKLSKGKKSTKDKHLKSSKSKAKCKNKGAGEVKPPEVQEVVAPPNAAQSVASRTSNPSLQESDFLTKTLDQVVESQFDVRSSKMPRNKARSRPNIDIPEKKVNLESNKKTEKPPSVETEQPKSNMEAGVDHVLETNDKAGELSSQLDVVQEHVPNDESEAHCDVSAAADANSEDTSSMEPNETAQQAKELKPKSLSLSEYRKRLQTRKPNPDREPEASSCSKWPSIPEPPTELAELPCLLVPSKTEKPTLQEKPSPTRPESCSAQVAPATSSMLPPVAPVATWEGFPQKSTEAPSFPIMDTTLPPMMPAQPNLPPPFYPPVWSAVPSQQPYYPGVPPLSAVPQFPNTLPPMMPMQPPPSMMSWPPFPPPPIGMGPMHPNAWASGPPPPYWSTPPVPQVMPEAPVPFNTGGGQLGVPNQQIPQNAAVPPRLCSPQKQPISAKDCKSGKKDRKPDGAPDGNKSGVSTKNTSVHSKPGLQVCSEVKKSESPLAQVKTTSVPAEPKAASLPIPDLKSANDVVNKIMEILKKAQKCGFQIKPPLPPPAQKTEKPAEPAEVSVSKSAEKTNGGAQGRPTPAIVQPSALTAQQPKLEAPAKEAKTVPSSTVSVKPVQASALHPMEALCTPSGASNPNLLVSNQKKQAEGLDCESGIEACDLTSLLEEFEKSEAKDEERLPPSPDKMAVGNSGSEQPMGKKPPAEKHLAPELVNTAGLTPPATPPHQLWKSASQPLAGMPVPVTAQEKPCASPLKTAKLIEPKPLPQSKLRSRTLPAAPSAALPAVHVASGDHDYCMFSATQQQKVLEPVVESSADATQREEGSRWNVKHHQNIVIKPIVQFSKRPQNTACPKQSAPNAPPVNVKSAADGPAHPVVPPPCVHIQKDSNEPLDHRTNVLSQSAVKSPPGSVLLSPDSSPCRSEVGETRTDARSEKPSASRRSLRCYRKFRNSPSPQKSKRRGRSSGSRSASSSSLSSSSSSRSRSRSPPMKRRRKYRSRSRHRSRSSSRSSYGSRSSSRSSSAFSCSPSSSRSRSRSRSTSRRRYRSRSRRCESRDSYYQQRNHHKERAIEERRVVYIGKINSHMTRTELRRRFSSFGDIEECTIHFREEGDNYGFVTYRYTSEAFAAIENGNKLQPSDEMPFDLCFGGRRQFCKSNYADLDSNRGEFDPAPVRSKFEGLDFDTLLREAQKKQRR